MQYIPRDESAVVAARLDVDRVTLDEAYHRLKRPSSVMKIPGCDSCDARLAAVPAAMKDSVTNSDQTVLRCAPSMYSALVAAD